MHELGLLGRYLPEVRRPDVLVQYDVYHKFSADQHSLLAVENLEALAPGQSAESEGAAQVFSTIERPDLLLLGMLLHDIGKAQGHGHVARGSRSSAGSPGGSRCRRPTRRRSNSSSPSPHDVAHRPATRPPRPEDRGGSGRHRARPAGARHALPPDVRRHAGGGAGRDDGLAGRDPLDLYTLTLARLTGGEASPPNRTQLTDRVCTAVRDEASRQAVMGHLAMMSGPVPGQHGVQRIAEHLRLVEQLQAEGAPVVTELFPHPDLGTSDLVVVTRDLPGLFAALAGTLAANGINIMSLRSTRARMASPSTRSR